MADDQRTTGIIPIDVSGAESWAGGAALEAGTCLFKVRSWSLPEAQTGSRMLTFHFDILDGPKEGESNQANRGQEYRRNFVYETDGGRNYYVGLVNALNEKAWTQKDGKTFADFGKLHGIEFEAVLVTRQFAGRNGQQQTGYDVSAGSVRVTKEGKADAITPLNEMPAS